MSTTEVSRFVTRALDDGTLREQVRGDSDNAFQGYDLTQQEREAISAGDEQALRHMGLDPMTAHSWSAFKGTGQFAPDMPDLPGDLQERGSDT